jgi:hypothetical protein
MAIRPPERRDDRDRRRPAPVDDLHQRIDEKRKQIDRRRIFRREADRERALDLSSDFRGSYTERDTEAAETDRRNAFQSVRGRPIITAEPPNAAVERDADLIDVHILDMAAQIEALLRSVREIQENVLRMRGALPPLRGHDPAEAVQHRVAGMLRECDALRDAVQAATTTADRLTEPLQNK